MMMILKSFVTSAAAVVYDADRLQSSGSARLSLMISDTNYCDLSQYCYSRRTCRGLRDRRERQLWATLAWSRQNVPSDLLTCGTFIENCNMVLKMGWD